MSPSQTLIVYRHPRQAEQTVYTLCGVGGIYSGISFVSEI